MNIELQEYILSTFPELFETNIDFKVNDGYFPLILFTCRYITRYCCDQTKIATEYPDSYKACEMPTIFSIGKDEEGFLSIKTDTKNSKLLNFIEFIRYISGSTCEISGLQTDNVYKKSGWDYSVVNRQYVTDAENYHEINSPKLVKLLQKHFYTDTYTQLEFKF